MLEVVRSVELDAVEMAGDAPLRFRVEVLRERDAYFARLCRWETLEVRPFAAKHEDLDYSIETLLIEDPFWDWRANPAASADAALDAVLARLESQLPGASLRG
jgi:hypothetical protein